VKKVLFLLLAVLTIAACGNTKNVAQTQTTNSSDSVPVGAKIPDTQSVPVGGKIPDTESVPVGGKIPDSESVPVGAKIPDTESVPVGGKIPDTESVPVGGKTAAAKAAEETDPVKIQWNKDQELIKGYLMKYNGLDMQFTPSGIYYQVTRDGNGKRAKATDKVKVNYKGTLLNGTVFDQNDTGIEFFLNQVIAGWTEGMQLVDEGGSITLLIPSYLAYGPRAVGGVIPANSVLRFDVDLLEIK